MASADDVRAYIRQLATAFHIPATIAVGVSDAESGSDPGSQGDWWVDYLHFPAGTRVIAKTPKGVIVPKGTPGAVPTSFGPFQLRAGQTVTGYREEAGLGDAAVAAGIDVTNPDTWREQIAFALTHAANRGTFAGTWSTAVGALGAAFDAAPPIDRIVPDIQPGPVAPTVGAPNGEQIPINPGDQPPPGTFLPLPTKPTIGGFADSFGGIAAAIAAIPGALTQPFIDAYGQTAGLLSWLGQTNIYERLGVILLGAVLVVLGIILFALSFVDRMPKLPIPG